MYRIKFTAALTGLFIICILNWKCTKIDTTDIGGDLIPPGDKVSTFDTLISVIANNFDSLSTPTQSLAECAIIDRTDENVLGYVNDLSFGKTTASIFFQVLPPSTTFSFPVRKDSLIYDSAVLIMSYKRGWGDSIAPLQINLQEVSATHLNFRPDSFYTSCNLFTALTPLLGSRSIATSSLKSSNNQLRIKLTGTGEVFGRLLLQQDTASAFRNDSSFKAFFRGFALTPGSSGNALAYFNLTDTGTRLALYHRVNNRAGKTDTTVTSFALANSGLRQIRSLSIVPVQRYFNI